MLRGAREREERELADAQSGVKGDRDRVHVRELERDVAIPGRVDESGGAVDQQAKPAERALSLHPGHHVVGQPNALARGAEDELAGVEDEGRLRRDLDELRDVVEGPGEIDERVAARTKHAKAVVEADVD